MMDSSCSFAQPTLYRGVEATTTLPHTVAVPKAEDVSDLMHHRVPKIETMCAWVQGREEDQGTGDENCPVDHPSDRVGTTDGSDEEIQADSGGEDPHQADHKPYTNMLFVTDRQSPVRIRSARPS